MDQDLPQPDHDQLLQLDQDLALAGNPDRYVNTSNNVTPEHDQEAIFIDPRRLWQDFFCYSRGAKRGLREYLDALREIQEASSSSSAAPQGNKLVQLLFSLLRRFQPTTSSPPAISSFTLRSDRLTLRVLRDIAIGDLHVMGEALEIAKLLPKPSTPLFSPALALWVIACSVSAKMVPNLVLAAFSRQSAVVGALWLLKPLAWRLFDDYNLHCLQREVQTLKRKFEDGTVSERNRKDLDSWHMEARSLMC
ncbi:hypothetical protein ACHAPT_012750 [Fusarium lateritium]